jgi:uncharacterized protein (TIGR02679 family)
MSMSVPSDIERLQRILGGSELIRLRQRLRARYERGAAAGEFTLTELSVAERRTLAGLLGKPVRTADSMRVSSSDLDDAVARAGLAPDLKTALEMLDGPLVDRKAQRLILEKSWATMLSKPKDPRLVALVSTSPGLSLLKRLTSSNASYAGSLADQTERVLARIPADGITLGQLAAETLRDSHALDAGRPVATLVLQACGIRQDAPEAGDERPREQWARLGVSVNELAWPALCLNLPVFESPASSRPPPGEPFYFSLRTLLRSPPSFNVADREVFVCENPNIVAIAVDRLGPRCAPLVCTDGMPSASQRTLLTQLAAAKARLRYHGDFDWPGLTIANFVMARFDTKPWRFGTADYLSAQTESMLQLSPEGLVQARWDDRLTETMLNIGTAVHEEAVVEQLLQDLTPGSCPPIGVI